MKYVVMLLMSVLLGSLIGYLNQYGKGPAGARTYALICCGATLVTLVSKYFFISLGKPWFADPGRLSAQIIPTLGFLATFILWFVESRAEWISIGVNMWLAALVGLIIGSGFGLRALLAIGFVILVLPLIRTAEERLRYRTAAQDKPTEKVEP